MNCHPDGLPVEPAAPEIEPVVVLDPELDDGVLPDPEVAEAAEEAAEEQPDAADEAAAEDANDDGQQLNLTAMFCSNIPIIQGDRDPSGQLLYFVDFDLRVPPCCIHDMPIPPEFQLPKQNKADI